MTPGLVLTSSLLPPPTPWPPAGTEAAPVATLARAAHLACTAFTHCTPIHVRPGNYSCDATTVVVSGRNMTIRAADNGAPPYFAPCDPSASHHLLINSSSLALSGVMLDGRIDGVAASALELTACTLLPQAVVHASGATVALRDTVVRGGTVSVDYTPWETQAWLATSQAAGWWVHAWCAHMWCAAGRVA